MIIGNNKEQVIANIQTAVREQQFNKKVEVDDPNLSPEEKVALVNQFIKKYNTLGYRCCNYIARGILDFVTWSQNRSTKIVGLENIKTIKGGGIITSNHFNPLDNTVVRKCVKKAGKGRMFIVSQEANLAMKGFIGFMMNHADIIPISLDNDYMIQRFPAMLKDKLAKKQVILIYPEQEMWFNYRKPRPPKRGAYYYAAKFNVPIISCFVEIRTEKEKETEEFYKVKHIIHVLKPIYPDTNQTVRENSIRMMEQDYKQKRQAYEKAYGKPLEYAFSIEDVAGWIPQQQESFVGEK